MISKEISDTKNYERLEQYSCGNVTTEGYSWIKIMTYLNPSARMVITRKEIEVQRDAVNEYFDQLYDSLRLDIGSPSIAFIPDRAYGIETKHRVDGRGSNMRKSIRSKVLDEVMDGKKYEDIAKDNNISRQRVSQIAKSEGIQRTRGKRPRISNYDTTMDKINHTIQSGTFTL